MKRFLLLISLVFLVISVFGQSPRIDSLKHLSRTSKSDKARLKAMLKLCDMFETLPKDTLWNYAVKARLLATKLHDGPSLSLAIIAQANAYMEWDNLDSAKALIIPELHKYKPADPAVRDIYFKLLHIRQGWISGSEDYKDAITAAYHIIEEAEKYRDSLVVAENLNLLSVYKYEMDFNKEAIALALKGLSVTTSNPRYNYVVINLAGNLAEYYYYVGKLDSAMYFADKTYNLSEKTGYLHFQSWAMQKKIRHLSES